MKMYILLILVDYNEAVFQQLLSEVIIMRVCPADPHVYQPDPNALHRVPLSRSFLILSYLPRLQSGGLQRYLMLIVHMKENLYEVRASGTDRASWG